MKEPEQKALIPEDAFESGAPEGTLGAEEELWLADPESLKLASGAQKILAADSEGHFSGELVDCEIESNTGVHREPEGVARDLVSWRRELLDHAERLGRTIGISGTHPIGEWREQEIIDVPHYRRLEEQLGWLIRRNNTFSLHAHYAVQGRERMIYLFNRLREYVPHALALSVNSPFWQSEITDMQSSRTLIFSRSLHRAGLPEPLPSWEAYADYVDYLQRSGAITKLGEIWWDIRPHPGLGTIEFRPCDSQISARRSRAIIALTAALCELILAEHDSGEPTSILPNREIEENKWSAQRYGLTGDLIDHHTHRLTPTREAIAALIEHAENGTGRDLSEAEQLLHEPTEADRQLEVWRETGSTLEVARDLSERTRASAMSR